MNIYKEKPREIEVYTWKEFIEYGKKHSENSVEGIPWSFKFKDFPVTHETDEKYLINIYSISKIMTPNHVFITNLYGFPDTMSIEEFEKQFEKK